MPSASSGGDAVSGRGAADVAAGAARAASAARTTGGGMLARTAAGPGVGATWSIGVGADRRCLTSSSRRVWRVDDERATEEEVCRWMLNWVFVDRDLLFGPLKSWEGVMGIAEAGESYDLSRTD
jgi:hypothetical protein